MKKIILFIILFLSTLSLLSCGKKSKYCHLDEFDSTIDYIQFKYEYTSKRYILYKFYESGKIVYYYSNHEFSFNEEIEFDGTWSIDKTISDEEIVHISFEWVSHTCYFKDDRLWCVLCNENIMYDKKVRK